MNNNTSNKILSRFNRRNKFMLLTIVNPSLNEPFIDRIGTREEK